MSSQELNFDEFGAAVASAMRHGLLSSSSTSSTTITSADASTPPRTPAQPSYNSVIDVCDWLYRYCDSYSRLPELLSLTHRMNGHDWVAALGELWTGFDNVGHYKRELLVTLAALVGDVTTIIPALMNAEEREAHAALPDSITIYRGCGPRNKGGFSWSLKREVAARFPLMARFWTDRPLMLTTTIDKNRIAALKLDRGEDEAIVFGLTKRHWTEQPLVGPPAF